MKLLRVLAMLVVAVFASSALADASVNLHNGYISILNNNSTPLHVTIHTAGAGGIKMFDGVIAPYATYHVNNCCYAAGSHYYVDAYERGRALPYQLMVDPRLCNTRGIPYGYASLFFGNVKFGDGYVLNFHRVDHRCP